VKHLSKKEISLKKKKRVGKTDVIAIPYWELLRKPL
jgi:hypothetical protein